MYNHQRCQPSIDIKTIQLNKGSENTIKISLCPRTNGLSIMIELPMISTMDIESIRNLIHWETVQLSENMKSDIDIQLFMETNNNKTY